MAVLNLMSGSYQNCNAVACVIKYILRLGKNKDRENELMFWGGWGVPLYVQREDIIASVVYVQEKWNIATRKGRRMFHETITIGAYEFDDIGRDYFILKGIIDEYTYLAYFQHGFQVVYAVHWEPKKKLHVHFAVNTINYCNGKKWHTNKNETKCREVLFNQIFSRHQSPIIFERSQYEKKILCS